MMSGETEKTKSNWTFETLSHHIQRQLDDLRNTYDERQRAQEKFLDTAIENAEKTTIERISRVEEAAILAFAAANKAVDVRTETLDKEFHEHMSQYRHEVAQVLASNDKAIMKAEEANEKRFTAHNAFREQLASQAASFLPREVADHALNDLRDRIATLTTRMDTQTGRSSGYAAFYGWAIAGISFLISAVYFIDSWTAHA